MGFARQMRRRHLRDLQQTVLTDYLRKQIVTESVAPPYDSLDLHALDRMADEGGPVA